MARGKEGQYQIPRRRGGRRYVHRLKKREGRPVSDTEEDRRKEMCPDTEKEGRRVGIRY